MKSEIACLLQKKKLRMNLKYLNLAVEYHHFKMETIQSVIQMMTKNCYMASVDLKDAYYSIPVHSEDRKYLRFRWNDRLYQFTCLPNGLSEAPRKFTKILKVPFTYLRARGHSNSAYIDDSALLAQTRTLCQNNVQATVHLLDELGFTVHPEKSMLYPQQTLVYLGFILNSRDMTVRLTPEKVAKIKNHCSDILGRSKVSIRLFATLIGTLVATEPGVDLAPLYYRRLEGEKTENLKRSQGKYDADMQLSSVARTDIEWWLHNVHNQVRTIDKGPPGITITTDSSDFAWGGAPESHNMQGGPRVQWN